MAAIGRAAAGRRLGPAGRAGEQLSEGVNQCKWVGDRGWMGMGDVVGGDEDGLSQLSLFNKASTSSGRGA